MSITTTDLAYLAGAIDSDGYIGIAKRKAGGRNRTPSYKPRVILKQVTPQIPEMLKSVFGGTLFLQPPSLKRGRPLWTWELHSAATVPVLTSLLPFLRIKVEQARNALALCALNAQHETRRFLVPTIIPGEPLVTATDAARATGLTYQSVCQSARQGTVPVQYVGRRVFIPESFLPIWRDRGKVPTRQEAAVAAREELYQRAKALNQVGVHDV